MKKNIVKLAALVAILTIAGLSVAPKANAYNTCSGTRNAYCYELPGKWFCKAGGTNTCY